MSVRLFNEYEARNNGGNVLGDMIRKVVLPLIRGAIDGGASTRDVEAIALEEVAQICAEIRIRRALDKSAKETL